MFQDLLNFVALFWQLRILPGPQTGLDYQAIILLSTCQNVSYVICRKFLSIKYLCLTMLIFLQDDGTTNNIIFEIPVYRKYLVDVDKKKI
jgi:hypothetical protein